MSVSLTPKTIATLVRDGVIVAYKPISEPDDERAVASVVAELWQEADTAGIAHDRTEIRKRSRLLEVIPSGPALTFV